MRYKAIDESSRPLRLSLGGQCIVCGVRMFTHLRFLGIEPPYRGPLVGGAVGGGTLGGGFGLDVAGEQMKARCKIRCYGA